MTGKMNWPKAKWDKQPKRSLEDDYNFRKEDAAARWLKRNDPKRKRKRFHVKH